MWAAGPRALWLTAVPNNLGTWALRALQGLIPEIPESVSATSFELIRYCDGRRATIKPLNASISALESGRSI